MDDCSTPPVERTIPPALAARLPLTVLRLERNGGPAAGRNAGVRACSSERVLFVDDDVVASPRLVERHASWHAQDPTVVVIGPLASPPDWKPTAWNLWEARKLEAEYRKMQAGVYAPTWRQFFTGNSSVQRTDLLAVGAFDERFTRAEDIELGIRLAKAGRRFVFDYRAVGWHYAVRTAESWLRIPASTRVSIPRSRSYIRNCTGSGSSPRMPLLVTRSHAACQRASAGSGANESVQERRSRSRPSFIPSASNPSPNPFSAWPSHWSTTPAATAPRAAPKYSVLYPLRFPTAPVPGLDRERAIHGHSTPR